MILSSYDTNRAGPNSSGNPGGTPSAGSSNQKLASAIDQYLARPSLFKNKDALSIHYIPDELLFRDDQILELGHILAPLLRSQITSNALLYGKPGTGKTVVVRFVINHITLKKKEVPVNVLLCYCNAKMAGTQYRLVLDLARQSGVGLPFTGLSVEEALSRVRSFLTTGNIRMLIVLDEIDYLVKHHGDDLLYELTRPAAEDSATALFNLVGISNDLAFKDWLDPRVLSSLMEEEIVFPPYTVDQLRTILASRADSAFHEGCVSDSALNLCAALCGSEHGDARRAVELLRVAGELTDREQSKRIEEEHIHAALKRIEHDRTNEAITTLPLHAKLLLAVTLEDGAGSTGVIYEKYSRLCQQLGLAPVTRRRASGILNELDVLGLLSVHVVSSGRYGRTKRVKTNVSAEAIRGALKEEPLVSSILH